MRYYVVRCGYAYEFRFTDASEAGSFIAKLAANVQMDVDEIQKYGTDRTSFDLFVYEERDPEIRETEEVDPEIVRPGELDLPFEEVSCNDGE